MFRRAVAGVGAHRDGGSARVRGRAHGGVERGDRCGARDGGAEQAGVLAGAEDAARSAMLERLHGVRVVRVAASRVERDLRAVLADLAAIC